MRYQICALVGVSLLVPLCSFFLQAEVGIKNRDASVLFEGDSIYNHLSIRQTGEVRCMLSGSFKNEETCMNIREPDFPVFEYTAMMFVGFLFKPESRDVLLIGLGGGYIPHVFHTHQPDVRLHIVEIDPMVIKLAREYFGFEETSRISLTNGDGRRYLKTADRQFDQIWIDAFNSDLIPAHMTTREFLLLTKSKLSEHGVVVQNVNHTNELFNFQVNTFKAAFRHVFVFEGIRDDNSIIVASDTPVIDPGKIIETACIQTIGQIDLIEQARKYKKDLTIQHTKILTDDYCPVNLFIHKRRNQLWS